MISQQIPQPSSYNIGNQDGQVNESYYSGCCCCLALVNHRTVETQTVQIELSRDAWIYPEDI